MKDFLKWSKLGPREIEAARRLVPDDLPRHVAVIMDGNGRWAKRRFLPRVAGHQAGAEAVRETIEAAARLGLEVLTLFAFSVENWKRPKGEVDTLWSLLSRYLRRELPELKARDIRFRTIGRVEGLPESVQRDLDWAMLETAANSGMRLNVALNYSGRSEIIDAVNALLARARNSSREIRIDEDIFGELLSTAGLPDPDLLIRTSGEFRVSNFLLWQIAYTEIWVTEKLWPDFRAADLIEAVLNYQGRERRFGGLGAARAGREALPALVGAGDSAADDGFAE